MFIALLVLPLLRYTEREKERITLLTPRHKAWPRGTEADDQRSDSRSTAAGERNRDRLERVPELLLVSRGGTLTLRAPPCVFSRPRALARCVFTGSLRVFVVSRRQARVLCCPARSELRFFSS
ncbi:hypothetical protein MHYP_G00073060 [Metynnis hypsauchen]